MDTTIQRSCTSGLLRMVYSLTLDRFDSCIILPLKCRIIESSYGNYWQFANVSGQESQSKNNVMYKKRKIA